MKLHLWNDLFWQITGPSNVLAYCQEHRVQLDVQTNFGTESQSGSLGSEIQYHFICPSDNKQFPIMNQDLYLMRRRFFSALEAIQLRDAEIVNVDGYQIPIAKARTADKDDAYWVEARINDTKKGKQLVVYAGKKGEHDKSQIFLDTENDKISFDQNNIHPSDVFVRLVGEFKSGKKTSMEDGSGDEK